MKWHRTKDIGKDIQKFQIMDDKERKDNTANKQ